MTIDYQPLANNPGANVESQAQYLLDLQPGGVLQNGFLAGTAPSRKVNKVLRQASVMTAALANFISERLLGIDVLDDGDVNALKLLIEQAVAVSNKGQTSVRGLRGTNNAGTPLTQYDISWDQVSVQDAGGYVVNLGPQGPYTLNISAAGPVVNGRDQAGAFAASSQMHVFAIYNPATGVKGVIASTAGTLQGGPTLPAGFTHWAYLTTLMLDGASQFYVTYLRGSRVYYQSEKDVAGAFNATVRTTLSTSAYLPGVASSFGVSGWGRINTGGLGHAGNCEFYVINAATIYTTVGRLDREGAAGNTTSGTSITLELPNTGYSAYRWTASVGGFVPTGELFLNYYTCPNGGA